jgi:predicted nucleic acid-binding protein
LRGAATQLLQSVSSLVTLDPNYHAPLRDSQDLMVLQTAVRGEADILCSNDEDFFDEAVLAYCATRGIEVFEERTLAERLSLL